MNEHNDALFEAVLRQAIIDKFEDEVDNLPTEEELASIYKPSLAFEIRMKKLFSKYRREKQIIPLLIWGKRVVIAVMVFFTMSFAILMAQPTINAAVKDVVIEWYTQFAKFISQNAESMSQSAVDNLYPSYLPSEFEEVSKTNLVGITEIIFANSKEDEIILTVTQSNNSVSTNNERIEYTIKNIDGTEYYIFASDELNIGRTVVWDKGSHRFTLTGFIELDELLKIAVSIS